MINPRLKLFVELQKGDLFHYGDTPMLRNLKTDDNYCIGWNGSKKVNPHVLVIEEKIDTHMIKTEVRTREET